MRWFPIGGGEQLLGKDVYEEKVEVEENYQVPQKVEKTGIS